MPGDGWCHVGRETGAGGSERDAGDIEFEFAQAVVEPDPGSARNFTGPVSGGHGYGASQTVAVRCRRMHRRRGLEEGSEIACFGELEQCLDVAGKIHAVIQPIATIGEHRMLRSDMIGSPGAIVRAGILGRQPQH